MSSLLAHVALGDLLTLPDGTTYTVRSRVNLTEPVRALSGFLVAGECQAVLTASAVVGEPFGVHLPGKVPPDATVHMVVEGAASYWAPHLPSLTGAMGELLWRVVFVSGYPDPVVVIYRGHEVIPFIRVATVDPQDVELSTLPRSQANDIEVERHAGHVVPTAMPVQPERIYETIVGR